MAKRVVDDASLTAVADKIRGHVGLNEQLNFPSEFLTGVDEVYNTGRAFGRSEGYTEGKADGITEGKQAEYNAFWDVFQNYGDPAGVNYHYHFCYGGWTDENFNPKYDLVCSSGTTAGRHLFYQNTSITDTKVPIVVLGSSASLMFSGATALVTIRELTVHEGVEFNTTFSNCTSLVNLTMGGTIGQNGFNLQYSTKLSKASIESVVNALSTTTSGLSATFSKTAVNNAFTDTEWATLANTRSNWTINLV